MHSAILLYACLTYQSKYCSFVSQIINLSKVCGFSIRHIKYEPWDWAHDVEFTSEYRSENKNGVRYATKFLTKEPVGERRNLRVTVVSRKKIARSLIRYFAYALVFLFLRSFFFSGSEPDDSVFLTTQHRICHDADLRNQSVEISRERKGDRGS